MEVLYSHYYNEKVFGEYSKQYIEPVKYYVDGNEL